MKTKEKLDILLTDAIEKQITIHTLINEVNDLESKHHNFMQDQIESEFYLAQHAHDLLKDSPTFLPPSDLELRMIKRIKRGRRTHVSPQENLFSIFSIIYVIAVILLMIFSFFQFQFKHTHQGYYQTPLRPLPSINTPLPK